MVIASNILNIIAPIVQNISFLFKSKTKVLFGVLLASVLWVIAFLFLGAFGTAALTCVGVVVPIVNYFTEEIDKKRLWWVYVLYAVAIVTITLIFYKRPLDIMPSVAVFILTLSTLPRKQVVFRLLLLGMSSVWLVYGIILFQYGIIIGNAIQIIALIVQIVYYGAIKPRLKKRCVMNKYMKEAIEQARIGIKNGDGGPFGCVIVKDNTVIGRGHNRVVSDNDPTCHGEVAAIRDACKNLNTFDLTGCELYTTGEPCPMCLAACLWANIKKVYYGCTIADNEKIGFRDKKFDEMFGGRSNFADFLVEIDRQSCLQLFDEYNAIKDKTNY